MVEDVIGVNLTAIAVVVKHIPFDVIRIRECFLFPRELYIVLGRSFTVVGADRPALCENLVQSHRLKIPVHTTHIVNLISASNAVQIRGVVYLEVRFIREVGVCVKVDKDQLNDETFAEKVGAVSIKQLTRTARERRPGSMGYAEAMILEYNGKKKSTAGKLFMNKLYARDVALWIEPDEEDELAESDEYESLILGQFGSNEGEEVNHG